MALIAGVFGGLGWDEPLWPDSARAYRVKWDAVLARLDLPTGAPLGLTPACLRGSGATHAYLSGVPVSEVAWRGRWRAAQTLEFYLQEVAALQLLNGQPASTRERVRLASASFEWVLAAFLGHGAGDPRTDVGRRPARV